MSRHFVPPLPATSNSGRVSYQLIQKNNEQDSEPVTSGESPRQHGKVVDLGQEGIRAQPHNRIRAREDRSHESIRDEVEDSFLKTLLPSSQVSNEGGLVEESSKWPPPFDDQTAINNNKLQPLPSQRNQILQEVQNSKRISVRSVTWNQQAQEIPSADVLREHLLPNGYHHVIAVGTQECENSISKSILYPGKENWEKSCEDALGHEYQMVRGHSLQASHL